MRGPRRVAVLVVALILTAVALSGCAALPFLAALPGPGGSVGSTAPVQHYSDGSTDDRGNIPKTVGEKAGTLTADGLTRTATFVVTRIVERPTCVNSRAATPLNGHFVEVDLHVTTTAALGTQGTDPTMTFAPSTWFYYMNNDNGGVGAEGNAAGCTVGPAPLPATIGPSTDVSGSVVLDVADTTRYLAYVPHNGCTCSSWDWPISSP